MEHEELEELFCAKISLEIKRFKQEMLNQSPEGIYEKAFHIDSTINIYELLLEMSQKMENKTLRKLMVFPKLLAFLYDRWMNTDDSRMEELTDCLERCIKEMEEEKQQKEQEAA